MCSMIANVKWKSNQLYNSIRISNSAIQSINKGQKRKKEKNLIHHIAINVLVFLKQASKWNWSEWRFSPWRNQQTFVSGAQFASVVILIHYFNVELYWRWWERNHHTKSHGTKIIFNKVLQIKVIFLFVSVQEISLKREFLFFCIETFFKISCF